MARTAWPTVASSDSWTASQHNTYGRDNDLAYWVYTTAGDISYATSSSALTRLAIGTDYRVLRVNGGVPAWLDHPSFTQVYKSTTQSFSTGSAADITWNQEVVDDGGWHSTSSNTERITVTATTGYYIPLVTVYWNKDSGGSGQFHLTAKVQKNGVDTSNKITVYESIDATTKQFTFGGIPVVATTGQYFSVNFVQDSGGSGNILGTDEKYSTFTLIRIR